MSYEREKERLKEILCKGISEKAFPFSWKSTRDFTCKEAEKLPFCWLYEAIDAWVRGGASVTIYSDQIAVCPSDNNPHYFSAKHSKNISNECRGVILQEANWVSWVNLWWTLYYTLDDGNDIYACNGRFVEQLKSDLANAPVIMVTQDNESCERSSHLKTRKWPIDKRKLIGYWVSLDEFVEARLENVSRSNPHKFFPGRNRKGKQEATVVNLTKLIRGHFDDHGLGTLYHIRFNTEFGPVYKIGLTKTSVNERYVGKALPKGWSIEVLNQFSGVYTIVGIAEQIALLTNDSFVEFQIEFGGKTECRLKPFDVDWEKLSRLSLDEAKAEAQRAYYRSFSEA